jgi:hypothetical protein
MPATELRQWVCFNCRTPLRDPDSFEPCPKCGGRTAILPDPPPPTADAKSLSGEPQA